MDALRENLENPDSCWKQPLEDIKLHVEGTATDDEYHQKRLAEGWLEDETAYLLK